MAKSLMELCVDIVAAQAGHTRLLSKEICESLWQVFRALQDAQRSEQKSEIEAPITGDPLSSIQRHHVRCLECGRTFQLLSYRHLELHGLTTRQYKQKHGIRMTQALSAWTLSARRRKQAKELGIGQQLAAWRAQRKHQIG